MDTAARTPRHAGAASGPGPARRLWWLGALLAVPAALAGLMFPWIESPRPVGLPADARPAPVQAVPAAPVAAAAPDQLRAGLVAELAARPITFPADSAEFTDPAAATVQEVASLLIAGPPVPVLVEGHVADTPGGPDRVRPLSEERAAAVVAALVAAGVPADRITARGRGAELSLPSVEESRRVEITVG